MDSIERTIIPSSSSRPSSVFYDRLLPEVWKTHITPYLTVKEACLLTSTCRFARKILLRGYIFDTARIILPLHRGFLQGTGARVGNNFYMNNCSIVDKLKEMLIRDEYFMMDVFTSKQGKLVIPIFHRPMGIGTLTIAVRDPSSNDDSDPSFSEDRLTYLNHLAQATIHVKCDMDELLILKWGVPNLQFMFTPQAFSGITLVKRNIDNDETDVVDLEQDATGLKAACMSKNNTNHLFLSTGTELRVYNCKTGKCNRRMPLSVGFTCNKLATLESAEEELIVAADDKGEVQVWDMETKVCRMMDPHLLQMYLGNNYTMRPLKGLTFAVYGSLDNYIRLYRYNTGTSSSFSSIKCTYVLGGHTGRVTSLTHLKDNDNTLISGSDDRSIKIWKYHPTNGYSCNRSIRVHKATVESIMLHPSRQCIISVSSDAQVAVTAIDDEHRLKSDDGPGFFCRYGLYDDDNGEEYFDAHGFFRR